MQPIPHTTEQLLSAGHFQIKRRKTELQYAILKHLAKDATDTYNYYRDRTSKRKHTDATVLMFYGVAIKAMDDLYNLIWKAV